jgi:hypothetical protein
VTRDVTAWAGRVRLAFARRALLWYRTDSLATCSRAWVRLGPLGRGPARESGASDRRCDRDRVRRDRSPNGAAWRVPDWTAVGFRVRDPDVAYGDKPREPAAGFTSGRVRAPFPDPFLGSDRPGRRLPAGSGVVGPARPRVGGISPRGASAPRAATVTRIACRAFLTPLSLGWPREIRNPPHEASDTDSPPVAGRRLPPCPHLIASQGLRF